MASFLSILPAVSARPIPSAFRLTRPSFQTQPTLHSKSHRSALQSPPSTSQFLLLHFFYGFNFFFLNKAEILVFFFAICQFLEHVSTKLVLLVLCLFGDGWFDFTLVNLSFRVEMDVMGSKYISGLFSEGI